MRGYVANTFRLSWWEFIWFCLSLYIENLFPCPREELVAIEHWEVGKYFTHYSIDHYVPNGILKQNYPYN